MLRRLFLSLKSRQITMVSTTFLTARRWNFDPFLLDFALLCENMSYFFYPSVNWHFVVQSPGGQSYRSLFMIFYSACLLVSLFAKRSIVRLKCLQIIAARKPLKFFIFYDRHKCCFQDVQFESKAAWSCQINAKYQQKAFLKIRYFIFLLWVYELSIFQQVCVF